MVSVQHAVPHDPSNTAAWLESGVFAPAEVSAIARAIAYVTPLYEGQVELTGAPLLQHALGAAGILLGMNMDAMTLTAAILHGVPGRVEDWSEKLAADFGEPVRVLVLGISRMEQIRQFSEMPNQAQDAAGSAQLESLRKMLLSMVEDIRVVLIKLALRTQTLRTLSGADVALQKRIAQETQSIFAPLANRLGVWQIKWELEDLAVRYLEPERYKKVAQLLDERRVDREQYIAEFLSALQVELGQAGIAAQVTGRPKHIYSIINKMKRKQLDFDQLYDVRAVRILVDDVKSCYAALGVVQFLWLPIPGEFDDYIARPKSNNYRSLHTAVIGPRGLAVEVQIRTHEMHQSSELGVAAHWRYKEGAKSDAKFDEQIVWLRQILEWKSEVATQSDTQFKNEAFGEQVYVFTPQGKVIDLPRGATPVDFAYTLHTDLGHRTRGAKVNGSIVPLNTKLQNGQRVEILTIKQGAPCQGAQLVQQPEHRRQHRSRTRLVG
jgi:GTP pyrophosphokinase